MTIYCAHIGCGYKNDYSGTRPKFCGACGNPFDAAFKRPAPVATTPSLAAIPATPQLPQLPPGYRLVRDPAYADNGEYENLPQSLPQLTSASITVEAGGNNTIKLTEQGLKEMGDISFERPVHTAPSYGDDTLQSSAQEMRQIISELRANPAAKPTVSTRISNSRRKRS